MGDSLIASIALAHNLALFTRNRSLFERVENLELVKMSESVA
jgi:predicted nucleic acid-binding protein